MKKHPIATIVNFCTNESRFLTPCLHEALRFSRQVIVCCADHFFDGKEENKTLLEEIPKAFPECQFIQYPFIPQKIPKNIFKKIHPHHFWHSVSRLVGFQFLHADIEMVFFLDADEIAEGDRVQEWLECSDYHQHTALKLANYWYFRESRYRADRWEDSIVLAQKKALSPDLLLHQDERSAIYSHLPHPKRGMVTGCGGKPLFHHYSWVRNEEEMLRKVQSWGHRKDRDWESLVRAEFQKPFSGTDFVHGYRFQTLDTPIHAVDATTFSSKGKGHRKVLTEMELLKIIRSAKIGKSLFFRLF
ncbi:MAG: hypothetical protein HY069_04980 [Chlamydiia bacterium]|nr:hypothetical protein [Chlamydiia bacterium]